MKIWFRRGHLVLGILTVFFLINLSISGALLVFGKQIQHYLQPNYWLITAKDSPLPLSQLVANVETASGRTVDHIRLSSQGEHAWQFQLNNHHNISVNHFNGNILHQYSEYGNFYRFVMSWHRWLLLTDDTGKKPLQVLVSITSLLLIIEILLGLWLWLKPKNRFKRLKINLKARPRVKYHQLHIMIGLFSCIPLVLIAFTGMAFHWQSQTKSVIEFLAGQSIENYQQPKITAGSKMDLQLDLALSEGLKAMTPGQLYRIYLPQKERPLALNIKMPGEFFAFSWVWINPYSAKVIKTYDASKANLATRIWNFKYNFHTGDFFGTGLKFIWLLLALLPGAFAITGIYLFRQRIAKSR